MGKTVLSNFESRLPRGSTIRKPIQVKIAGASGIDESGIENGGFVFTCSDSGFEYTSGSIEVSRLVKIPW